MAGINKEKDRTGLEIAVTGMAGRFPGAKNIAEFWDNLKNGVESICFFSGQELEQAGENPSLIKNPNYVKAKGVLHDSDYFDAGFFGYMPGEAQVMDPQMRVFYETVWEALEDAGYDPGVYPGRIGLYAGASSHFNWEAATLLAGNNKDIDSFSLAHFNDKDYLCLHISYKLNLKGPGLSLHSTCSTSLVAVHLAVQALLNGECEMALAGGVCLSVPGKTGYVYEEGMVMSPDGHCRAFDAKAQGTVSGEGVGVVVLKSLEDAVEQGDHIYALVKGSAVNNDGFRKAGFTAPGIEGQVEVISAAMYTAEVEPETIGYIETHGTGTMLGDPVEIGALELAFDTEKQHFCRIGSVKTNIGHLDTAAGIAGFIKTVLILKHGLIPPNLHFETPNPKIDFDHSPFYVNRELTGWKRGRTGTPLRAGVSSFGIGGTNAHVVLEEAPIIGDNRRDRKYRLILLSARNEAALEKQAQNLSAYLKEHPDINFADTAYTLQAGRKHFEYRKMLVCSTPDEAVRALSSPALSSGVQVYAAKAAGEKKAVFMFPGQGSQYVDMGRELYETEPAFREDMDRCLDILRPLTEYDIKEFLYPFFESERSDRSDKSDRSDRSDNSDIHRTEIAQPVLFIFEYALAKLLIKWGIRPYAMIGHSIGEYTAACLAGVFSLEHALKLVVLRGKLMQRMPPGAMLSVPLAEAELKPMLNHELSLAAVNSSSLCVVSGPFEAVETFEKELAEKGYRCRLLHTSHAFHSSSMEPVLEPFEAGVAGVVLNPPEIPYISNLTGNWVTKEQAVEPAYWAAQLREKVCFAQGLETLLKNPDVLFVEVGPGKTLGTFVRQHAHKKDSQPVINLVGHPREDVSDIRFLLSKAGLLWLNGVELDWREFHGEERRQRVSLPAYPFERRRFPFPGEFLKSGIEQLLKKTALDKNPEPAEWFYVPQWTRSLVQSNKKFCGGPGGGFSKESPGRRRQSNYLIFIDGCGLGEGVVKRLERENQATVVVRPGEAFLKDGETHYAIDPAQPDHYLKLIDELLVDHKVPDRIFHFWGVAPGEEQLLDFCFYSLLYLVQAFGNKGVTAGIQLGVVTDNMQEVQGGELLYPQKAVVLGAVKVIPQEYPNIGCFSCDIVLPEQGSRQEEYLIGQLLQEFETISPGARSVVALRGLYRWVQTFEPVRLERETPDFRQGGVYLITGGLGGIGYTLARHLAKQVNARLILTGRRDPGAADSRVQERVRELEILGAEVLVLQADTVDYLQMQRAVREGEARFGPVNGVIHAAGLADYEGVIQGRTGQGTDNILASKLKGTLILDDLLKDRPLDFFILCSSLSSILAPFGQVGYAAANAFLDAFAVHKSHNHTCTHASSVRSKHPCLYTSINWDAWQEVGMAVEAVRQAGRDAGVLLKDGILPEEGVDVFERILAGGLPQVVVSTQDLGVLLEQWYAPAFTDMGLTGEPDEAGGSVYLDERPGLSTVYIAPENETQQVLARIWQDFFGIKSVGVHDDFFELGGDSLKAMTVSAKIHKTLHVEVPLAEFFRAPTVAGLTDYIRKTETVGYFSMEPVEEREYYDLSYAQRRLWIICQFEEESPAYNLAHVFALAGEFNTRAFQWAVQTLVDNHESLRTVFIQVDQEPKQKILKKLFINLDVIDLRRSDPAGAKEKMKEIYAEVAGGAFDLEQGPLFRLQVISPEDNQWVIMFCIHHIITDGWSQEIIINEITTLYNTFPINEGGSFRESRPPNPPAKAFDLVFQYKDYALWHNALVQRGIYDESGKYWLEKFKDRPNGIELPLDHPRKVRQTFNGGSVLFELDETVTLKLQQLCFEDDATLFMGLLAVFAVFLFRFSGQSDIIVGSPAAGRKQVELQEMVGFLVNTLVFRIPLNPAENFKELLVRVKQETLEGYKYQDYPFDLLVEHLQPDRDLSQSPLFNVMLAHTSIGAEAGEIGLTGTRPGNFSAGDDFAYRMSVFDLVFLIDKIGDRLFGLITYNSDLFESNTAQRLAKNFLCLVENVPADPETPISRLNWLDRAEYEKVVNEFNRTHHPFPDLTIREMFEDRVEKNRDAVAVVDHVNHITYGELNKKANRLAFYLIDRFHVGPGDIVGLSMDRSLEMVIGILGIVKTGAGYAAIDPNYPEERVLHMLDDAGAGLLLSDGSRPHLFRDYKGNIVNIHERMDEISLEPGENPGVVNQSSDVLYVIYTSGTTGTPNGAVLSHGILANLVQWQQEQTSIDASLRCLQFTSVNFCVSFQEIMITLVSGGQVHLIDDILRQDIDYLMAFLASHRIGLLYLPFSYLNFLFNESTRWQGGFKNYLEHIITAGEQLKITAGLKGFLELNPGIRLHNHYGSSEMHVVTSYTLDAAAAAKTPVPPAGKPIANTKIYILDEYGNPVPIGVWGELCIAGSSEVKGYINNKPLTEKKLMKHPLLSPDRRLYCSGDLGRWLEDGNIELKGRKDSQVKVRGFRVELSEIESKILAVRGVKDCVVVVKTGPQDEKYLLAYVVTDDIEVAEIKRIIDRYLPRYMIPEFMKLERLPLMPNGKVDRDNLPEPQSKEAGMTNRELERKASRLARYLRSKGVAPGTPVGVMIESPAEMVASVLGILKAGGTPVPLAPGLPSREIIHRLEQDGVSFLLTRSGEIDKHSYTRLRGLDKSKARPYLTAPRPQIEDFDALPFPDRSLVDYETYGRYIGLTEARRTINLQATRGCPYNCLYCHKIWPKHHVFRSAENIVAEVKIYYDMGVRRFAFVDDIFNLNARNSRRFFELIIKNGLKAQLFFPNGLRCDLLSRDYIDLMAAAGTVSLGMALETASPRLQQLIRKNMNLEKLRESIEYFCETYPGIILGLFLMTGFPTETEAEALMTLDFIKGLKWLDFPYLHLLKIYPHTDMAEMAVKHGISPEAIANSASLAFHELPETLPFSQSFARTCQADFLNNYFLLKERLLTKLPYQMKVLTEVELVQKYNSYLPVDINGFDDLLEFTDIKEEELGTREFLPEEVVTVPGLNEKIHGYFSRYSPMGIGNNNTGDALRVLLLDLSQFFSSGKKILYDGVEPPLGLLYLMTYLYRQLGRRVTGKVAKSRVDFDSYSQLKSLLEEFQPHVIGIRTLTYYQDFFHQTVSLIRHWGFDVPVIAGGPYATSDYETVLQDENVDLVVLSEGELTLAEIAAKMLETGNRMLSGQDLEKIPGIAFLKNGSQERSNRQILLPDQVGEVIPGESGDDLEPVNGPLDLADVVPFLRAGLSNRDLDAVSALLHIPAIGGTSPTVSGQWRPRDPMQNKLTGIWARILELEPDSIGIEDNFFDLGGHSLKATILSNLIFKELEVKVPLVEIFKSPTVEGLAEYINNLSRERFAAVDPVEKKEYYPLSSAQKRLYLLQQMQKEHTVYNMPGVYLVVMPVSAVGKLERAFNELIRRHESLRTSFHMIAGQPVQRISEENYKLQITNYKQITNSKLQITNIIKDFVRPFDLSQAPLVRVGLIHTPACGHPRRGTHNSQEGTTKDTYLLMVDMHHIISDGVSHEVLVKDFTAFYAGKSLSPLRIRYKDFSQWQNRLQKKQDLNRQEGYWLEAFKGEIPVLDLPIDYNRPVVQSFAGNTLDFEVDRQETRSLKTCAAQEGATLFMVLLALYNILLAKLSGQEDIVIGSPSAGRRHADLEKIIGMFVNTLALRNYPYGWKTCREFLREIKKRTLNAFENQDYPFEDLVEKVEAARDIGRNPLFDVMFAFQNVSFTGIDTPGFRVQPLEFENPVSRFDLTLQSFETEEKLVFTLEYCTELFKEQTIRDFIRYFKTVVSTVIQDPGQTISQIEILSAAEKNRVLYEFNDSCPAYPVDRTIQELFEEQVEKTPDHVAVVEAVYISYKELSRKAGQLAGVLKEKGVLADSIVGIMAHRSIEMIMGILGILKAGGAYLPIDLDYPQERIDFMLKDSGAKLSVTTDNLEVPDFPLLPAAGHRQPATSLAYVIYTSGSTGKPKGVLITHANISPLLHWGYRHMGTGPGDRTLQNLAYIFDWSVWEIFITLTSGACFYIAPDEILLNPEACTGFIREHGITILHATPSQLGCLVGGGTKLETLRYLFIGAEKLGHDLVRRSFALVNAGCRVFNMYGPTEAAIISAVLEIDRVKSVELTNLSGVPIGKPAANAVLFILDKYLHLCPVNVSGELYIGGDGLAPGYLNNPELTNEKLLRGVQGGGFLEKSPPGRRRHYKTGDLGRWLTDGNIEFLGRIDFQVKIRGFRIELGEIEARLLEHGSIKEAVVMDRITGTGENYLCAYIVRERVFDLAGLTEYLSKSLPGYMIPAYFIDIDKIPLSPGGKVDRKALPAPQVMAKETYAAPGDEIEIELVKIWSEVLDLKAPVGIDANFFDCGGHSLKAAILTSTIHKTLGVDVPLTEVFKRQTIRNLSQYIKTAGRTTYADIEPVEKREYYGLSSAQKRLYFIQQIDPGSTSYNMPLVLSMGKDMDTEKIETTLKRLVARHESLRTSFIMVADEPVQRISEENYKLQITNYKQITNSKFQITNIKDFVRPFDLSQAPLIHSGIMDLPDGNHLWIVDMHHIISDGTSLTILAEDFMSLYSHDVLEPLRIQYKDFSGWQNRLFAGGMIKNREDYWLDLYWDAAQIPRLQLDTDFKRPGVFTFAGDRYDFVLAGEDADEFKALGAGKGATLYMNILAVLNTLFYKYTGQGDIIIGTGIAGRPHADLQRIIGMFVNTLAMRNHPAGEKTYETLLEEVIDNSLKAFENQDLQFEELVDKLDLERDASRNPLFDIMMVVQNFRSAGKGVENLSYIEYKTPTAKFDMTFYVREMEEDIYISIEYYTAIFKRDTFARLVRHLKNILVRVTADPEIMLKDLDIVSEQEKQELLYVFSGTGTGYPREKTIGELFAEQVEKVPDGCAVVLEEAHLTYRVLACEANRLANYLHDEIGVEPDQRVGLLMDRSIDMIAAIMGILEVGGAYVPVSVSFPEERMKTMIDDAGIRIMVSQKKYIKALNRLQWECRGLGTFLCMDSRDVHGEEEVEESELMSRKLWEYVGETAVDEITGGGWNSSYTGEPIPGEEMDEYGDNILKKLEPLLYKNMRVLEIGAASGISMYRIAPRVGLYYGTDLSGVIIRKNEERVEQEGHANIKLRTLAAHEIHRLEEKNFDLVILNSVVQCFHGHNYLGNVIRKAISLMADRGYIFIGDIMDLDLKDDLIADLKAFKQTHREKNYKTKIDWSGELFISRLFLEDLASDCPGISDVEFSGKIHTIENELTRFRYDALIHIDKTGPAGEAGEAKKNKKRHKYQHDRRVLERYPTNKPGVRLSSGSLCYVIYTSGSTGRPKGTLTTHCNVTRVVKNTDYIEFYPGDRVLQLSDYAFDGSVFDIFGALLNGCTLVIATREHLREIAALFQLIRSEGISVFLVTTALFNTMVDINLEGLAGVRKVLFGGERVSVNHAAKALAYLGKGKILHMYGPTETAVYATWYPVDEIDESRVTIPIGRPTANTRTYILDSSLKPVPIGITGEIHIGGPGVGRGYLNNPELTAEKFNQDLWDWRDYQDLKKNEKNYKQTLKQKFFRGSRGAILQKSPPGLLYKTGDLARWLPDGCIEFIGRIDHQVKIRGFRIELEEIEGRLLAYPGIDRGIVVAGEDETGSRYLAAYLQMEETIGAAELRDYLSQSLPDYMIPAYFVRLDGLPLGSTGKIDRAKLPDPRISLTESSAGPRDELEEKVAAIWSGVLGIGKEMIGPDANFFELGGHSLKAVVVTSRIYKELNVKIPLAELFKSSTLRALGEYIRKSAKENFIDIRPVEQKEYYEVSFNQERLWIIQQRDRDNPAYNMAGMMVFHDSLPMDEEAVKQTVGKILERHESLRTGFREMSGIPVQYILEKYPIPFDTLDISHLEEENRQKELKKIIHEFNNKPFNLDEPPLFKSVLVKNPGRQWTFLYNMHHIVSDGWSLAVLERDFQRIFRACRDRGDEVERPGPEITYKDFACWRNRQLEDETIQNTSRAFWEKLINEELPPLHLPHDFKSGTGETSRPGGAFRFVIPEEVKEALNRISREHHITLFSFMFSIYNIFLSLVSGQRVIVSGVVNAGRDHPALQDMVGFFVNLVICKTRISGDEVFMDFAVHIQQTLLNFFQHQNYPLERVMDEKGIPYPEISASFNMINMGSSENMALEDPGASHHDDLLEVKFDIEPIVTEYRNGIEVNVIYNKNRFKAENIEIMMKKYQRLIEFFSQDPYKRLNDYKQKFLRGSRGRFFQKEPPGRRRQVNGEFCDY